MYPWTQNEMSCVPWSWSEILLIGLASECTLIYLLKSLHIVFSLQNDSKTEINSVAFSPQANYTEGAIAACWRS
jgi:hypothetical protein